MTAALVRAFLDQWALEVFSVAMLLIIWGLAVQFDSTIKNDAAGKFAMLACTPIALLTGAVIWGGA